MTVPVAAGGVTEAVRAMLWPRVEGFALDVSVVVVAVAAFAVGAAATVVNAARRITRLAGSGIPLA